MFLAHGKNDKVTPRKHTEWRVEALRGGGKTYEVAYYEAWYGWIHQPNRIDFYGKLQEFLLESTATNKGARDAPVCMNFSPVPCPGCPDSTMMSIRASQVQDRGDYGMRTALIRWRIPFEARRLTHSTVAESLRITASPSTAILTSLPSRVSTEESVTMTSAGTMPLAA